MKLLDKYIYKKVLVYELALLAIFSVLVISSQIMHLPSVFYHIDITKFISSLILINISFLKIQYLIATSLAFFFTGIYLKENREIIAIKALGVSKKYLLRLVLFLSLIFFLLSIFISFLLVPTANRERISFITESVRNHYLEAIQPKNFFHFSKDTVIYVEEKKENSMKDVFLYNKSDGKLITAKEAVFEKNFLILKNGIIQIPSENGFSMLEFEIYRFKLNIDYSKSYTFDDYTLKELVFYIKNGKEEEKNKAVSVVLERFGYLLPFLFIGVISFFLGSSFEREKEFLLAVVLMILIFYMLVNFYLLKLIEDGKIPFYVYPFVVLSFFGITSFFVYKKSN